MYPAGARIWWHSLSGTQIISKPSKNLLIIGTVQITSSLFWWLNQRNYRAISNLKHWSNIEELGNLPKSVKLTGKARILILVSFFPDRRLISEKCREKLPFRKLYFACVSLSKMPIMCDSFIMYISAYLNCNRSSCLSFFKIRKSTPKYLPISSHQQQLQGAINIVHNAFRADVM